jgi:hypothetical protein
MPRHKGEPIVEPNRTHWLTLREVEMLHTLKRVGRVKDAAYELKISYRRGEYLLQQVRRKWKKSVVTHNMLLAMCKRDEPLRKILSSPAPKQTPKVLPTPDIEDWEDSTHE